MALKLKMNVKALLLARATKCLTTVELSQKSGVGRTTINKIENGCWNPNPSTLGKLAKALNVSVETLISEE